MTNVQKAGFFFISGMLMMMCVVGGVEASPDLMTWDGVYLAVFTLFGIVFGLIGVSYAKESNYA